MQENIRYRTIGGIFLGALAVIVLPMLLDEPTRHSLPEPDRESFTQAQAEVANSDSDSDSDSAGNSDLPIYDEVVPASDVVEKVTQLRAKVDSKGFSTEPHRTLFGEPILTPVRLASSVFAVQLATFVKLDNARAFREKLRAESRAAFVSSFLDVGRGTNKVEKVRYRVAVGPLLSHTGADELRDVLAKKYDVDAIVVDMTQ
jgi:cell division septation protein DedD